MSENFSLEKEDSGGLVSFISEPSGKSISVNEQNVIEDMVNQGEKSTQHYVRFTEPETEEHRKTSTGSKNGATSSVEEHRKTSIGSNNGATSSGEEHRKTSIGSKNGATSSGEEHRKTSIGSKNGATSSRGLRTEETFSAHRNTNFSRFKYTNMFAFDDGDLLKPQEKNKGKLQVHYDAEEGNLESLLNLKKSMLNVRDDEGWSPVMYAALRGQLEALKLLKSQNANLQAMDPQGRSLLHIAASSGHELVIIWLLELGFDINATDFYEMTPIHLAAASNQVNATRLLISKGADLTIEDDRNRSPLKIAQIAGHPEIIDLLRNTKKDHY